MIAFHGIQATKDFYLARIRAHTAADELIHGVYWENGKGCAVGCTVHSSSHAAYEAELGIPRVLAKLEDSIFETLGNGRAKLWPEEFLAAPRVGADLSLVWPRFAVWLLVDPAFGVIQFNKSTNGKKAIQAVADAYQSVIDGTAQKIDWLMLRNAAAYAYAAYAAYVAYAYAYADAYAYVAYAYAAADAAAAAVAYADAYAYVAYAYAAADADAARNKFRNAQADKLIELMTVAPVPA